MSRVIDEVHIAIKEALWGEESLEALAKELGCGKTVLYNLRAGLPLEHCRVGLVFKLMERYKLSADFEVNDGK